jgi:hypothetical protein
MTALNGGCLDMRVLFLNARYDHVCECTHSRLAEPMRTYCRQLTEETIRSGHWLAQEKPVEVNEALVKWLATTVPDVWPQPNGREWMNRPEFVEAQRLGITRRQWPRAGDCS